MSVLDSASPASFTLETTKANGNAIDHISK